MLKSIILLSSLLLSPLVFSQDVKSNLVITCGKTKAKNKRLYPIDAAAIKYVASKNVVTCNSKRIKAEINKTGVTVKVVRATQKQIDAARAKIDGFNTGSFKW